MEEHASDLAAFEKEPVSIFILLNSAEVAIRSISSISCDTSTWICILS
jgi:hypothetical protein